MRLKQLGAGFSRRIYFSFVWSLIGFVSILVLGTLGYKLVGGAQYTYLDALFMTFITVTTIGYEEVISLRDNPAGQVFTMVIAFSGIGLMTYFFSTVTAFVLESDLDITLRRRRMEKAIKNCAATTSSAARAASDATWKPNWKRPIASMWPSTKTWRSWNRSMRKNPACSTCTAMPATTTS